LAITGIVVAVVVAVVFVADLGDGGGGSVEAGAPDETTTTVAAPCVAVADALPAGAPEVPVHVGPPPTALVSEDLVTGDGAEVTAGATVTVDYIGVACSTGKIFDSSYATGQPATFSLDGVIAGWTQGIPGMKVGGRRLLGIPPELAYGDNPTSPDIAPGETLWFVVDVRDVQAG
jgi:peptidylprolyl isomerase